MTTVITIPAIGCALACIGLVVGAVIDNVRVQRKAER